jgi:NADPH:quinone reductase-like Zn-dependent oxidoreductase
MKSSFRTTYGSPRVLTTKDVEIPKINPNEILIRVMASTVNRTDCAVLTGEPFVMRFFTGLAKPNLFATGTDFAGIIEKVGDSVSDYKIGDRVFGFHDEGIGSHAEYLAYPIKKPLGHIPENVTYETAAASLEGAHYAINFMNKVSLKKGDNLLIYGASGAIGSALVQLALTKEITISVVTNSATFEYFKSLGLKKVVDYQTEDFSKIDDTFDCIFDAVGKSTYFICRHLLKPKGVYISSELGPWLQNPLLSLLSLFKSGKKVKFPVPVDIPKSLKTMQELLSVQKFVPLIDRMYHLEDIAEAFEYTLSGKKNGNVIIKMD